MTRFVRLTALGIMFCIAAAASGQSGDAWLTPPRTASQMLADQLVTLGLVSLESNAEPTEGQLMQARVLFDHALELVDDDAELWRLRAELASLEEDAERRIQCLRQYARLRPDDDAVQLELILHAVQQDQTLDGRLSRIERILESDAAQQFSAPLRSRLASAAAGAAEEIGDRQRYARWLKEALRLDGTNAAAAHMTYAYTTEHTQDPLRVGAALVHLIRADPSNPQARLTLARLLAGQVAHDAAARQYAMASNLAQAALPTDDWQQYVISLASAGKYPDALRMIEQAVTMIEQAHAQAAAAGTEPPPVAAGPIELLRLSILHATEQAEPAAQSFARLREASNASGEGAGLSLPLTAAVFGQDLELAERAAEDAATPEADRARLRGWIAFHRGQHEEAAAQLAPLAADDGIAAFGVALAQTNAAQRQAKLLEVARDWPQLPVGMMAALRLARENVQVAPTEIGGSLLKLMDRTPPRIWAANLDASPWVSMKLDVLPPQVSYLEPLTLQVTLRNVSGLPLAVGPQSAVSSRLWVVIEPSIGGRSMGPLPPIVVDLARTLRLDAGQTLVQRVRLDRGRYGLLRAANPATTLQWRVTGVLDARANRYGVILPGPVGTRIIVGSLVAAGTPVTAENIDLWLADLESDDSFSRHRAVGRLLYALANPPEGVDHDALRSRIGTALNGYYDAADRVSRAWLVGFLGVTGEQRGALQPIIDNAERSDDPLLRQLYVLAVADAPDHPALLAGMRHADPMISGFAEALRASLERQAAERAAAEEAAASQPQPEPQP